MLSNELFQREITGRDFSKHIQERINKNIYFLDYIDVERDFESTVCALDVERAEGRYVLRGENNGNISLVDLFPYFSAATKNERNNGLLLPCLAKSNQEHKVTGLRWFTTDNGMFFSLHSQFHKSSISIWDTNLFSVEQTMEYPNLVISQMAPSPAASSSALLALAVHNQSKVLLCDLRVGDKGVQELGGLASGISCIEWCPQVEYCLATASSSGDLSLFDIRKPFPFSHLVTMNQYETSCVSSCPKPTFMNTDESVKNNIQQDDKLLHMNVCWSPNDSSIAKYSIWHVKDEYQYLDKDWESVLDEQGPKRKALKYNKQDNHSLLKRLQNNANRAHSNPIQSIEFLYHSRYVISFDIQGIIHVWDVLTGYLERCISCGCFPKKRRKWKQLWKTSCALFDNTWIYALDRKLYFFNILSGHHDMTIDDVGHPMTCLVAHPWEPLLIGGSVNGSLLCFGTDYNIGRIK
eukprot:jgi/Galph1/3919/GphlegSOOS_G2608.1